MKIKNHVILGVILIISLMIATGCGAKSEMKYDMNMESTADSAAPDSVSPEEAKVITGSNGTATETSDNKSVNKSKNSVAANRKLIKRMTLSVETLEFDQLIESLAKKIDSLEGYMESSEMSGNTYLQENNSRDAYMVIRIPSNRLDDFVTTVKELGNVTHTQESTEDITLQYVDTESHKEALIVEHDRLLEILKDAKKLEDIIQIEERLSQVRYEIGSYESQLRTYDNLVDYSTVTLSIREVQHITPVRDETVVDRMKSGLANSFFQIKTGSINFAVWFVTNLPFLIIWAIILYVVGFILKKRYKSSRLKEIMKNTPVEDHKISSEETNRKEQ